MKKCRECKTKFEPHNSLQVVCSPKCALANVKKETEKKAKQEAKAKRRWVREQKERLKSRGDHLKEAQQAFNNFIRERDRNQPCISCGTYTAGQYHAGHYRTVGGNPELRFEELNCHRQCAQCNGYMSGNIVEYRIRLVERIGAENVEWLEGPHEPKKYTIEDIKQIKAHYRARVREMRKEAA